MYGSIQGMAHPESSVLREKEKRDGELCRHLQCRVVQDRGDVGFESDAPGPHFLHELLGPDQFPVPAKQGVHELDTGILSEAGLFLLARFEHRCLAILQEEAEHSQKTLARVQVVVDEVLLLLAPDTPHGLLCASRLLG